MKQDEAGNPIVKALVGTEYCTRQINMHEALELEASADTSAVVEDKFVESIKAIREELDAVPNVSVDITRNSLREIMSGMEITTLPNVTSVQSVVLGSKMYGELCWTLAAIRAAADTNRLFDTLVSAESLEQVANDMQVFHCLLNNLTRENLNLKHAGFSLIQVRTIEMIASATLNHYLYGDDLVTEETVLCEIGMIVPIVGQPAADAIKRRMTLIVKVLSAYV